MCDLDATFAQSRLRWEVVPITGINRHRELVSCGIMYASLTNQEVLTWLLQEICRIVTPVNVLKTIVTDEDAAFIAAFRNMQEGINGKDHIVIKHVLYALHKQRNFTNKP